MTAAEAAALHEDARKADILGIWTVTTGTADFGSRFVARPHFGGGQRSIRGPGPAQAVQVETFASARYLIADTLEDLRKLLPPGLVCLGRLDEDERTIVESWV
jgi:hypothetical protein